MVVLLSFSITSGNDQRDLAPAAGCPLQNFADTIWALHRTMISPQANRVSVRRAAARLAGLVRTANESVRVIVAPLGNRLETGRTALPSSDDADLQVAGLSAFSAHAQERSNFYEEHRD
jgi:hypothetical protein